MKIYRNLSLCLCYALLSGCTAVDIDEPTIAPVNTHKMGRIAPPSASPVIVSKAYGYYSGSVDTRWINNNSQMKLLSDFSYTDPDDVKWLAPKGSIINGASIPAKLWGFVGSPYAGKYRRASVVHDIACVERVRPWQQVHKAFYNAMKASGVSEKFARLMYVSVYYFGPRWEAEAGLSRGIQTKSLPEQPSKAQLTKLKQLLENNQNKTLNYIETSNIKVYINHCLRSYHIYHIDVSLMY